MRSIYNSHLSYVWLYLFIFLPFSSTLLKIEKRICTIPIEILELIMKMLVKEDNNEVFPVCM